MVVILDLGDGLDEAEQEAYDQQVAIVRSAHDTCIVWTSTDHVPAGRKQIPAGVFAWAEPDTDAPNPRKEFDHLAKFAAASPRIVEFGECSVLEAKVRAGYDDDEIEAELRSMRLNVAAIEKYDVGDATIWGYIERPAVMSTVAQPTTPEEVETFLALDVTKRGKEILDAEASEYRAWANGEVYAVYVRNTLNGRQESLHGCYDDGVDYLRAVVDDLVLEVTNDTAQEATA